MSKFDEKVSLYQSELESFGQKVDSDLLTKVQRRVGLRSTCLTLQGFHWQMKERQKQLKIIF